MLAVDPSRQGSGIGSHLLRKAEGILLHFRCRFVTLRVPQWREDVLRWASKCGYKETGGGLWGELDEERADHLTRPTRYFVMTVSSSPGVAQRHIQLLPYWRSKLDSNVIAWHGCGKFGSGALDNLAHCLLQIPI